MKHEKRLTPETRALLAAHGWRVRMLYQPEWLFRPGYRKLPRVAHPDDPWSAMLSPADAMADFIGSGHGDTPEEAVLAAFQSRRARLIRGQLSAAMERLSAEVEMLTAALKPGGLDRNVPF